MKKKQERPNPWIIVPQKHDAFADDLPRRPEAINFRRSYLLSPQAQNVMHALKRYDRMAPSFMADKRKVLG